MLLLLLTYRLGRNSWPEDDRTWSQLNVPCLIGRGAGQQEGLAVGALLVLGFDIAEGSCLSWDDIKLSP